MIQPLRIEADLHFDRRGRGSRRVATAEPSPADNRPAGRVPRVTRLMALAIRFDRLVRSGEVADYAELAQLGHVTRARISQISNLSLLAPDIQEEILFLPRVERGRDSIHLWQLQPIAVVPDWRKQRRLWTELTVSACD